jgi:hypothetical protein
MAIFYTIKKSNRLFSLDKTKHEVKHFPTVSLVGVVQVQALALVRDFHVECSDTHFPAKYFIFSLHIMKDFHNSVVFNLDAKKKSIQKKQPSKIFDDTRATRLDF